VRVELRRLAAHPVGARRPRWHENGAFTLRQLRRGAGCGRRPVDARGDRGKTSRCRGPYCGGRKTDAPIRCSFTAAAGLPTRNNKQARREVSGNATNYDWPSARRRSHSASVFGIPASAAFNGPLRETSCLGARSRLRSMVVTALLTNDALTDRQRYGGPPERVWRAKTEVRCEDVDLRWPDWSVTFYEGALHGKTVARRPAALNRQRVRALEPRGITSGGRRTYHVGSSRFISHERNRCRTARAEARHVAQRAVGVGPTVMQENRSGVSPAAGC
jgi:hypothetical protein